MSDNISPITITKQGVESSTRKKKIIKRSSLATILLAIVTVIIIGRIVFWWFTPALIQRNMLESFFSSLYKGNYASAYQLTSIPYRLNNNYTEFLNTATLFKGQKFKYGYKSYLTINRKTAIIGSIAPASTTVKKEVVFTIVITSDPITGKNSIDSFYFSLVNIPSK